MAVNPALEGMEYVSPAPHLVSREEIVNFSRAVRTQQPIHCDVAAAQARGYRDVVASPTFAVTLAQQAEAEFMKDPRAGVNYARLVHGEESFEYLDAIVAGDVLMARTVVARVRSVGGNDMVTLNSSVETTDGVVKVQTSSVVVIRGE